MKTYPSIDRVDKPSEDLCLAFYKYDGSNLRVEYNAKSKQWQKWGTRRRLFDESDPEYAEAIKIFNESYTDALKYKIKNIKELRDAQRITAFLEFFGPHSFAGQHEPKVLGVENNDPKELVLFDVNIHKKGMIGPRKFVKYFNDLKIPQVLYDGPLDEKFVEDVRKGQYPVNEGVVCKGGDGHKIWMRKIKTYSYLSELKTRFSNNWEEFWE